MTEQTHRTIGIRLTNPGTEEWLVPPELIEKLVADAEAQETNLTEVAIKILSNLYGIPYAPGGRRTEPKPTTQINLRLPLALLRAARRAGSDADRTANAEIRHALCAHYRLSMPEKAKPSAAAA